MGNSAFTSPLTLPAGAGVAIQFIAPASGTLQQIWISPNYVTYLAGQGGIYSDVSGQPGTLLTTALGSYLGGTNMANPPLTVTAGQAYWFAYVDYGSVQVDYQDMTGTSLSFNLAGGTLPANFSSITGPTADTHLYAIWAVICSGGVPTSTYTPVPCGYPGNTCTFTPTDTPTDTYTATPTPTGTWYTPTPTAT